MAEQHSTDEVPCVMSMKLARHEERQADLADAARRTHQKKMARRQELGRGEEDFDYYLLPDGLECDEATLEHLPSTTVRHVDGEVDVSYPSHEYAIVRVDTVVDLVEVSFADREKTGTHYWGVTEYVAKSFSHYNTHRVDALVEQLEQDAIALEWVDDRTFNTVDAEVDA
ncbi:hypothetical protein [Halobaculum marinum]|uniref:Uncharacterized protein n=1 Tax=Halobaculum marinum TaxID=3031996 RepID=A0ABD5WVV8_9EURY|nr:hypothetical protein [Halobaculum sp. DT55]